MFITRNYKLKNVSFYGVVGILAGSGIGFALQYIDRIDSYLPTVRGMIIGFFVGTTV
jgi:hypothetical protein